MREWWVASCGAVLGRVRCNTRHSNASACHALSAVSSRRACRMPDCSDLLPAPRLDTGADLVPPTRTRWSCSGKNDYSTGNSRCSVSCPPFSRENSPRGKETIPGACAVIKPTRRWAGCMQGEHEPLAKGPLHMLRPLLRNLPPPAVRREFTVSLQRLEAGNTSLTLNCDTRNGGMARSHYDRSSGRQSIK
jgi:hypothetical protein